MRRGRIADEDVTEQLQFLVDLPVELVGPSLHVMLREVTPLALRYELSAYDAAYFHLAQQHALPIATLDGPLKRAAENAGVSVIAPPPAGR